MLRRTALALIAALGVSGSASADDLFSITATNGGTTITAGDEDVIDLSESAIETFGVFSPLSGSNITATLTYAGVPNAVRYTVDAAGNNATLEFPITGFSRAFTGANADDLADQIEDFVLEDGADEYADLLKAIRAQSVAAVLDGNPGATTARLARHTFELYGTGSAGPGWARPNRVEYRRDDTLAGTYPVYADEPDFDDGGFDPIGWFELTPSYESTEAGDFDGDTAAIHAAGGLYFNEYLGVSAGGSFAYSLIEDTDIFHSTFHVGLNWAVIPLRGGHADPESGSSNRVGWELTPFIHSGIGASEEAAAGGAFVGAGLASNVQVGLHERVFFNWGAQIVYADGVDLEFENDDDDDIELNTDLSQSLVSTGLIVTVFLDDADGNLFIDGGLSYFSYLDDAGVDEWVSPEVGFGWRLHGDSRIRASYRPIFGTADYEAHTANVNLVFTF